MLFTCVQAYEYSHAAFAFSDGIYPSTFFMATGFHGFHVLVGTIFLIVCFVPRLCKDHFKPEHHFGFEAAAWYWHFVDVVWLFLFMLHLYLGRRLELREPTRSACPGPASMAAAVASRHRARLPLPPLRRGAALCGAARRRRELLRLRARFRPA